MSGHHWDFHPLSCHHWNWLGGKDRHRLIHRWGYKGCTLLGAPVQFQNLFNSPGVYKNQFAIYLFSSVHLNAGDCFTYFLEERQLLNMFLSQHWVRIDLLQRKTPHWSLLLSEAAPWEMTGEPSKKSSALGIANLVHTFDGVADWDFLLVTVYR